MVCVIYIFFEQTILFYVFQEMPNVDIDVNIYFSKWFTNWYAIIDQYKYVAWIFVFFFPSHTKTNLIQNSHLATDMLAIQHSTRHWKFWVSICSMLLVLTHPTKRPNKCTKVLPRMQSANQKTQKEYVLEKINES